MLNITQDSAGNVVFYDPALLQTFVYNEGDISWILASTALVWIMIPGLGYFYSGLLRRKNALSMIYLSMATLGIVSFQARRPANARSVPSHPSRSGSSGGTERAACFVRRAHACRSFSLAFSDSASPFIGDLSTPSHHFSVSSISSSRF